MQIRTKNSTLKITPILIAVGLALLLVLVLSATQQVGQQTLGSDMAATGPYRILPNEIPPEDDAVAAQAAGISLGDSAEEIAALDEWYSDFAAQKRKSGPNPRAYEKRMAELAAAEAQGVSPNALGMGEIGEAKMLMVSFEFNGEDTFDVCEDDHSTVVGSTTVTGPLHGTIPDPALVNDNSSFWTDNFDIAWYDALMFGDGVGVVREDLNDGAGVDLSGVSARNWYLEQSEGLYDVQGEFYPTWIQLDHSVAYYGWESGEMNPEGTGYHCFDTSVPSGRGNEFVIDVLKKITTDDPDFDWSEWDTDDDGVVDHFMLIHAGVDNSAGGGAYGNYQLWAHSWDVFYYDEDDNFQLGWVVDDGGTPEDPDDDIKVINYTHIPEDAGIGVVVHEYGHDIGLPDYYDTAGGPTNSAAHWAVMASGAWDGELPGTKPTAFNPWARYFFGWSDPKMIAYDDPPQTLMIGQSEPTPAGTEDSVWIGLPYQTVDIENLAGDGKGLHAILGNQLRHTLVKEFDLSAASAPVFTFDTSYVIEEDWDYTYVRVSTDGGATWDILLNDEGEYGTADPNGSSVYWGPGGLTGAYDGTLTYDLSAYAGESAVLLAFDYVTDEAYQDPGIWVDNFSLDDGATNLYANDLEDSSDWDNTDHNGGIGWEEVPYSELIEHYYMLEWRNGQGSIASNGQNWQYYYAQYDENGKYADKFPANTPGMLLWYRNNYYSNNASVSGGREYHLPGFGPKGELLLVDSHYDPVVWSGGWWDPDATPDPAPAPAFSNRRGAMDGAFGLNDVPPWWIHDYNDLDNEVMDYGSREAQPAFHDSMRSVPGWIFPGDGFVYRADRTASVVIPGYEYTTRVRGLAADGVNIGEDATFLWGFTVGGRLLGSGNPGDTWSHYGVHLEVVDQADDGSYGVINFHNKFFESTAVADYGAYANLNGQFAFVGQEKSAEVMLQNVGGIMADVQTVIEIPDNVAYVPGSMSAGMVGISRDDAANINQAAQYVKDNGFLTLLGQPEPANVGFIATFAEEVPTSAYTVISYDYVATDVGTASPQYRIDHFDGSTFGIVGPLPDLTVSNYMVFSPIVPAE